MTDVVMMCSQCGLFREVKTLGINDLGRIDVIFKDCLHNRILIPKNKFNLEDRFNEENIIRDE